MEEILTKLMAKGYTVTSYTGDKTLYDLMKQDEEGEIIGLTVSKAKDGNITIQHVVVLFRGGFIAKGIELHHSFIDKPFFDIQERRAFTLKHGYGE